MNRRLSTVIVTGLLLSCLVGTVSAAGDLTTVHMPKPITTTEASSRAEQLEYYYRVVDGKWQKRLWSITEGKWLTDWIDM